MNSRSLRRAALPLTCAVTLSALAGCSSGWSGDDDRPAAAGTTAGSSAAASPDRTAAPTTARAAATSSAPVSGKSTPGKTVDVTGVPTGATRANSTQGVLTYASVDASGNVVAGGYEAPVVEDGGTCTLTLTLGGTTVTATSTAEADASTSICDSLTVDRSKLSAGRWTAVLRYQSPAATGQSPQKTVEVPA